MATLRHRRLLLPVLLLLLPAGALACASIQAPGTVNILPQDAAQLAAGQPVWAVFELRVRAGNQPCELEIGAGRVVDHGSFLALSLRTSPLGPDIDDSFGAGSMRVPLSLAQRETRRLDIYAVATPLAGGVPDAGLLRRSLRLSLFDVAQMGNTLVDERDLNINVHVPSLIRLDLTLGQVLDLGELFPGVTGQIPLAIQANTPVTLELQSLNDGELRHASGAAYAVRYQALVQGQSLDLAGGVVTLTPALDAQGRWVSDLRVIVSETERLAAGTYQDQITLTVRAR